LVAPKIIIVSTQYLQRFSPSQNGCFVSRWKTVDRPSVDTILVWNLPPPIIITTNSSLTLGVYHDIKPWSSTTFNYQNAHTYPTLGIGWLMSHYLAVWGEQCNESLYCNCWPLHFTLIHFFAMGHWVECSVLCYEICRLWIYLFLKIQSSVSKDFKKVVDYFGVNIILSL